MMKTSPEGIAFIRSHEGAVLTAYRDPVGVLTIGVGHTSAAGPPVVTPGMKITLAEAEEILARDLAGVERDVTRLVKVPLTQPQFDALVSFTFNLGAGNFAASTLLKKLNAGDYEGAAAEFSKWVYAKGKRLPGLVRRRAEEADMFRSGIWRQPDVESPPAAPAAGKGLLAALLDFVRRIFARG